MAPNIDPNELFAWLRVCPDAAYLRDLQKQVGERMQALGTSRMAPVARAQPQAHYVQMTDETRPGGVQAQPMTGPQPAPNFGIDLAALAAANRRREEAQQDELRGPGPVIERVDVGEVEEGLGEEGDRLQAEAEKQAADKVREGLAEAAGGDDAKASQGRQGEQAGPAGQQPHGTPGGAQQPPGAQEPPKGQGPPKAEQPPKTEQPAKAQEPQKPQELPKSPAKASPQQKQPQGRQGALPARERQKAQA